MRNKDNPFESESFGSYIDVDGIKTHYYEDGYGTTVLFIHGVGQSMYTFRNNVQDFASCFHVITVDLPGHGDTDAADSDYLIEDYSEFLQSFLNALGIDTVHIFAFSTGAMIALDFALAYPDRVNKMILLTPGGVTPQYPAPLRNCGKKIINDFTFTFFKRNNVRDVLDTAYFDKTNATDSLIDNYFDFLKDPDCRDALVTSIENWDDTDVMDNLNGLRGDSIFIFWGECDDWHPIELLEEFEDKIPDVYAATVRNGGHILHEEKSREINRKSIELLLTDGLTE